VGKKSHKRPVDIRVLKIEDGRDGQEVVSMAQGYGLMHGFVDWHSKSCLFSGLE
jgi:hypothetical protein